MIPLRNISEWEHVYTGKIKDLINHILTLDDRKEYSSILWVLFEPLYLIFTDSAGVIEDDINSIITIVDIAKQAIQQSTKNGGFSENFRQEIANLCHKKICVKCKYTTYCQKCNTCYNPYIELTDDGCGFSFANKKDHASSSCKCCNSCYTNPPTFFRCALYTIDRCIKNPDADVYNCDDYLKSFYQRFVRKMNDKNRCVKNDWTIPLIEFFGDALSTIYPEIQFQVPKTIESSSEVQSTPSI